MKYYDYDENQILTCTHCGWSGQAKDGSKEYFDPLFTIDCPQCSEPPSLLIVEYSTTKEEEERTRTLNQLAETVVKERIQGMRKGTTDIPNWTHSLRVRDSLIVGDYSHDAVLGGLLHDIVEDGETSLEDLRDMGFPARVVALVDLCSHDVVVENNDARWLKMMARLVDAQDGDAWAIKVADITDNLKSCHTMPKDRQQFMKQVKGELMLRLSKKLLAESPLWQELNELVH